MPLINELPRQWVSLDEGCTADFAAQDSFTQSHCTQQSYSPSAKFTVVVVGNSHTEQFMGALIPLAAERDWQLIALLQPGCDFAVGGPDPYCAASNGAFLEYVLDLEPDVVVTNATRSHAMNSQLERTVTGIEPLITKLTGAGVRVVGIRDHPRFDVSPTECVESGDIAECSTPRNRVLLTNNPANKLAQLSGYRNLDFTDLICPDHICRPIIGNVLVWLDADHLTRDYAETMAVAGRERIVSAIEDIPEDEVARPS